MFELLLFNVTQPAYFKAKKSQARPRFIASLKIIATTNNWITPINKALFIALKQFETVFL